LFVAVARMQVPAHDQWTGCKLVEQSRLLAYAGLAWMQSQAVLRTIIAKGGQVLISQQRRIAQLDSIERTLRQPGQESRESMCECRGLASDPPPLRRELKHERPGLVAESFGRGQHELLHSETRVEVVRVVSRPLPSLGAQPGAHALDWCLDQEPEARRHLPRVVRKLGGGDRAVEGS